MNKTVSKVNLPTHIFICVLLLCVWFSGIALKPSFAENSYELVYCPLQKKWVKGNVEPILVKDPLDEFCSSSDNKKLFTQSFLSNPNYLPTLDVETLFLEYVDKGERAFTEIDHSHELPPRELISFNSIQKASSIYKNELVKKQSANSIELNSARPPNTLVSTKFEFPTVQKQSKLSHQNFARPPPVELS